MLYKTITNLHSYVRRWNYYISICFSQLYDSIINAHYLGVIILLNNNYYHLYCLVINSFKIKRNLQLDSINVDFEDEALIKAVSGVINNIMIIEYLYYYNK